MKRGNDRRMRASTGRERGREGSAGSVVTSQKNMVRDRVEIETREERSAADCKKKVRDKTAEGEQRKPASAAMPVSPVTA